MQTLDVQSQDFIPISARTLGCCEGLSVDVYLKFDALATPTLFCSRDLPVDSEHFRQLIDSGVSKLYIESSSYTDYQSHLRSNWKAILNEDRFSQSNRTVVMTEVVRAVLSEAFTSKDTDSVVETCNELGNSIVSVLAERPLLVSELYDVMYHDYATFTHSSNVASYISVLALNAGKH